MLSCIWVTVAAAATATGLPQSAFLNRRAGAGATYFYDCGSDVMINQTLVDAIDAA